jgi:hypothetical protein
VAADCIRHANQKIDSLAWRLESAATILQEIASFSKEKSAQSALHLVFLN